MSTSSIVAIGIVGLTFESLKVAILKLRMKRYVFSETQKHLAYATIVVSSLGWALKMKGADIGGLIVTIGNALYLLVVLWPKLRRELKAPH